MVNFLDDQLLNITETMKAKGMWENTLMVLSSDNGGYVGSNNGGCNSSTGYGGADSTDYGHGTACFNGEAGANNWPLRGGKYSMWEGGIRVNAFASGGYLAAQAPSMVGTTLDGADGMIHIADWYATFAGLAGVDPTDAWAKASGLPAVDSLDVWRVIAHISLSLRTLETSSTSNAFERTSAGLHTPSVPPPPTHCQFMLTCALRGGGLT